MGHPVFEIVLRDIGPGDADALHLHVVLFLARFFSLFFLVVTIFSVIDNTANRGARFGRDLNQIEFSFFGHGQGLCYFDDTDLFTVGAN